MFDDKDIKPMLIGIEQPAFNDPNFIYELKLDGVRCIAYIDKDKVELRNKRNLKLTQKFPELKNIYQQAKKRCILDGELYVYKDGKTDFFEIQKRTLSSDRFKIQLSSKKYPATFTAFDVLYVDDKLLIDRPLIERKKILNKLITENDRFNISRYIETNGIELFDLTTKNDLEGIVAKRKDSKYFLDKRSKDWIKCKNLIDEDYVIVGYIIKEKGMVSLVLAQYDNHDLIYKGHVTLGVSLSYLNSHSQKTNICPFLMIPKGNEDAIWIHPFLVGSVKFMKYTENGGLRQPVFKGFRDDKTPEECLKKE